MNVTAAQLVADAEARTGLRADPDASFWEGLRLVADGLDDDRMTASGRAILTGEAVRYLENRLRVDDYHARHPELAWAPVEAPVVILGLPRTGTTVLSYLLDQDPRWRSLLNWEAVNSVPPPTTNAWRTDPRCLELLEFQRAVLPTLDPPPPHWEWADGPTECTFLLAQDFRSAMWGNRISRADYRDFIETCDMAPAYRHHKRTLQVLQSRAPGRWVLKMPAHAYFIDGLLEVYPDARIVWTHRDPFRSLASFLDLAGFAQTLSFGAPDQEWVRSTYPRRLGDYIRRAERALAGRDVHHVHYDQVTSDPVEAVRGLYDWLGAELTEPVAAAMRAWVAADPVRKPRARPYSLADWGLTRDELDPVFADYAERHGVRVEE